MSALESVSRHRMRLWLAVAPLAVAAGFAACTFPEDDYGFAPDKPVQDAATDKADAPSMDVVSEDSPYVPPEGGDADAAPEADAPADVAPDVAPDSPADAQDDVLADAADAPSDAPLDVAPDAPSDALPDGPTKPPLNVWHIPANPEPPTVYMRNPQIPEAGKDAYIYFGVQPKDLVASAKLFWWWSGQTPPQEVAFAPDSYNGNNQYYVAKFPMPARPIGTFRYYIEVVPLNPAEYSTTYVYGTDATTQKTTQQSTALASPYKPDIRLPLAGSAEGGVPEIVITEVMVNALSTPESGKEWFEVYNAAAVPVTLEGCKIGDNSANHVIANPELILWPGVYAVFGASLDPGLLGGFVADHAWTGSNIELSNSGDLLKVMLPNDTVIDTVNWTTGFGASLYAVESKTMQHTASPPNASSNDFASTWCVSKKTYGLGTSFGTPQAATDNCQP
ncbi:MAG TPA: lamin tail domain-containing protein [Polyangiaceae bacterium]|nr:lamin tail domain-containing protein [Polyangiaceae bacterium]